VIRCPECDRSYPADLAACTYCGFAPPEIAGLRAWAPELALAGGGFKPRYFADLAALEAGNFWFRARNALILWALRKYFPDLRSFMEIGCGTGYVLSGIAAAFPAAALSGSEVFSAGLAFAAARVNGAAFMQMDGRRIPFEGEFDVIGAFDVIEHIREDEAVLASMYRALRPGGGLILTVPQHPRLWSGADEYACHERRYTAREIHDKVRGAGFRIVRSTSFVTLLLPAMLASRLRGQQGREFDPVDEFRIPPLANRVLEGVMGVERAMIRLGLSLPVGGSRLVVAQRDRRRQDV
jgi:SAM-dependent methyltransferase